MSRLTVAWLFLFANGCRASASQTGSGIKGGPACGNTTCTIGSTMCAADGTVVECTPDTNGCLRYPSGGGAACGNGCFGPVGAASCECTSDPGCPDRAGLCTSDGDTIACTEIAPGCYTRSIVACAAPRSCTGGGTCDCPFAHASYGEAVTVGQGCLPAYDITECDSQSGGIDVCTIDAASGCALWQASASCDTNHTCAVAASTFDTATASCQCPANTSSTYYVDAIHGSMGASGEQPTTPTDPDGLIPTGVANPPECRFKRITDALQSASYHSATQNLRVVATGAGNDTMTFADETMPLSLDFGVTLTTDEVAGTPPGKYRLTLTLDSASRTRGISLGMGTTLSNFAITATDSASTSTSTAISSGCGYGAITLSNTSVDGSSEVATGLDNDCGGLVMDHLSLSHFSTQGMFISNSVGNSVISMSVTKITDSPIGLFLNEGNLTAAGLTIQGASEHGIIAQAYLADFICTPCTVTGNAVGIFADTGLTLDEGSVVSNNTGDGIDLTSGVLIVAGTSANPVEIAHNGGHGVSFSDDPRGFFPPSMTLTHAYIHDNGSAGVHISNPAPSGLAPGTIALTDCDFAKNTTADLVVDVSAPLASAPHESLNVTQSRFADSPHAIWFPQATTSAVSVTSSTFTNASDTAILFEHVTEPWFITSSHNTITNNGALTIRGTSLVGGVFFHADGTWPGTFGFTGNAVFSNAGDQLGIAIADTASASSMAVGLGTDDCDTTANSYYCYDNALAAGSVGVAASAGTHVSLTIATHESRWQNGWSAGGSADVSAESGNVSFSGAECAGSVAPTCPNTVGAGAERHETR